MILEYFSSVNEKMQNNDTPIKFGMINIEKSRIIEARFSPLHSPDFKLFLYVSYSNDNYYVVILRRQTTWTN